MKRWAANILCLLSLLVLTASITIWVRSCFEWEGIERTISRQDNRPQYATRLGPPTSVVQHLIAWAAGAVSFRRNRRDGLGLEFGPARRSYNHFPLPAELVTTGGPNDHLNLRFAGFQLVYGVDKERDSWGSYQRLILPLWLFLPTAIPPLLWLRHRQRNQGRGFAIDVSTAPSFKAERLAMSVEQ